MSDINNLTGQPQPYPMISTELNAIIKSMTMPCKQPIMVLVEAALHVPEAMILALFSFDPYSMMRGYVRPKDRRLLGRYKSKTEPREGEGEDGKEHKFWEDGFPDASKEVGKKLPGADFFTGRRIGKSERFLWVLPDTVTRGLWYWFVMAIGEDGLSAWQSAVCKMECPTCSGPLLFSQSRGTGGYQRTLTEGMTVPTDTDNGGIKSVGGNTIVFKHPSTGNVIAQWGFGVHWPPAPPPPPKFTASLAISALIDGKWKKLDCTTDTVPVPGTMWLVTTGGFEKATALNFDPNYTLCNGKYVYNQGSPENNTTGHIAIQGCEWIPTPVNQ